MKQTTSMQRLIARCILFLFPALLILSGCQTTSRTSVALPEGTQSPQQIHDLFVGKTVRSVTVSKGRVSESFYDPNGEIRQLRADRARTGTWEIRDDARICLKMGVFAEEKCRIIVEENGVYRKYVVKLDGNHAPVVDYVSFQPGNPLGL